MGKSQQIHPHFFPLYLIYLSGLASLSKSDKQVFPAKMVMHSLPCLVSTHACEGGGGELCVCYVCVYVSGASTIYTAACQKAGLFNLISYVSVLQPMKMSQFKTTFDMRGSVLHALGDERCVRHI